MPLNGPIILVEDDIDDQEIFREVFEELKIVNVLRFFNTCLDALNYLLDTLEKPLLIISDINLPAMTGLQFKEAINSNDYLRKKSIPFVFLSTNREQNMVARAFDLAAHGYFVKPPRLGELKQMIKMIIDYWKMSNHPERA